jgi:hypothetical protein
VRGLTTGFAARPGLDLIAAGIHTGLAASSTNAWVLLVETLRRSWDDQTTGPRHGRNAPGLCTEPADMEAMLNTFTLTVLEYRFGRCAAHVIDKIDFTIAAIRIARYKAAYKYAGLQMPAIRHERA